MGNLNEARGSLHATPILPKVSLHLRHQQFHILLLKRTTSWVGFIRKILLRGIWMISIILAWMSLNLRHNQLPHSDLTLVLFLVFNIKFSNYIIFWQELHPSRVAYPEAYYPTNETLWSLMAWAAVLRSFSPIWGFSPVIVFFIPLATFRAAQ